MHIPLFHLYPSERTMNIISYYFLLVIDIAGERDNEIRGALSIIICGRSLLWTLKPALFLYFSLEFNVQFALRVWT